MVNQKVKSFIVLFAFCLTLSALAKEEPNRQGDKAIHGIVNILTFPLELPMQCYKTRQKGVNALKRNPPLSQFASGLWGMVGPGSYKAAGRALLGVYQLGGFWTLNPKSNENIGVPLDGEYSFDFDEPATFSQRTCGSLMRNKLNRGAMNFAWGATAEFPLIAVAGYKNKEPVKGLVKGTWYALSRVWNGAYELSGFLLPSHVETEGYTFEIDDPWNPQKDNSFKGFNYSVLD